jgi:hypothetical protein
MLPARALSPSRSARGLAVRPGPTRATHRRLQLGKLLLVNRHLGLHTQPPRGTRAHTHGTSPHSAKHRHSPAQNKHRADYLRSRCHGLHRPQGCEGRGPCANAHGTCARLHNLPPAASRMRVSPVPADSASLVDFCVKKKKKACRSKKE